MRKMAVMASIACMAWLSVATLAPAMSATLRTPQTVIPISGGKHGIGFDDLGFFTALGMVSVPAGQTGQLVLLDPKDGKVAASYRVTAPAAETHRHEAGTSSAAYGDGYIFASDHGMPGVAVLNAHDGKLVTHIKLASGPDYIRYLEPRHELWVTEPRAQQIQVFSMKSGVTPVFTLNSIIPVAGGPESLVFDTDRHRAYTNLWKDKTVVIDTTTHKQLAVWENSCKGPRGLALDVAKGFLFVACTEGKVAVLDVTHDGKSLAIKSAGAGIDIISYAPGLHYLYVPGARSATMTLFKVSPKGSLHTLAIYRTAEGAHCVTDDGRGTAFVCDPHAGAILMIKSP
jgi:DNA-binding beta-propeller fold protein YncE